MRRTKWFILFIGALLAPIVLASPDEAPQLAASFATEVLQPTYGVATIHLSLRSDSYVPSQRPERFWITVTSEADLCGNAAEELGEIYLHFVQGDLYGIQWLPTRDPRVSMPAETTARVLRWARDALGIGKQMKETDVPSTVPTRHLEFVSRDGSSVITLIVDRQYGFLHGASIRKGAHR